MTDTTVTKDFTREKRQLTFKLDDDIFTVRTKIMTIGMMRFAAHLDKLEKGTYEEQIGAIGTLIQQMLVPESAEKFTARLNGDVEPPIDLIEARDVIDWLMTELGMRPTEQSESFSDSHDDPDSGTSLTESASETVLISTNSPSIAS